MGTQSESGLGETLAVFETTGDVGEPLTTREVTDHLDCTRRTVYDRLNRLVDHGELSTKKVGARGRIWWRPTAGGHGGDVETTVSEADTTPDSIGATQFTSLVDDISADALFILDAAGRVQSWNRGAERIKGYEADEVVGRHVSVFYPADQRESRVPEQNLLTAAREGSIEEEGWRIRKDGSRFRAQVTISAVTNDADDVVGYVKVTRDLTQRYRKRARLTRQRDDLERELEAVFERVDDNFLAVDESFRLTYVTDQTAALFGASVEQLVGETLWGALTEIDRDTLEGCFERAFETQERTDCEGYLELGDRWLSLTVYPSETGLSVYLRDDTARRERERELERYEAAVETIGDGVYIVDDESEFVFVNDAHTELTGYDREELLGSHGSLVTTEEHLDTAERRRDRLVASDDGDRTTLETELLTKEGERIPVETQFALFPLGDDRYGRVGVVRDVTDRRERERQLEARVRQQEVVTELGQLALEHHDVDYLMARASELVSETLDTDYCKVLDLGEEGEELLLRQGVGWNDGIVGEATVSAVDDDSQAAHTLRTERPIVVEDIDAERRFSGPDLLTSHGVVSGISTIVGSSDSPWGILGTHDTERQSFTEHDVNFVQSVAHILAAAIDRYEHERELEEYETIVETVDDGVYVLDGDYNFTKVNGAYAEMMGYDREELLGAHCSLVVGDEISAEAAGRSQTLVGEDEHATLEAEIERDDGSTFVAESRFTALPGAAADGDDFVGTVGIVRDTTERRQRERELERQREQLAALNDLSAVIRGITDAVIAQSTREEVESVVCDRLADAETYQFAWIGELDRSLDAVRVKVASGCSDVEGAELPIDVEATDGYVGTIAAALQTQTVHVRRGVDPDGWADDDAAAVFRRLHAESGIRSTVAIPIVHQGTAFGVLTLSTDREHAFEGDELATIGHLGEIIGHALASIDRKRALMNDEVVELQFRSESPDLGAAAEMSGVVEVDGTVAIAADRYLTYGTVTEDAVDEFEQLVEANPRWEELTVRASGAEHGERRFELVLSEPPVTSAVAAQGGEIAEARIVDGALHFGFHLPPSADVRAIIDVVQSAYPGTEMVTRRQRRREGSRSVAHAEATFAGGLTDRQRAALEASYYAGFFEWPRERSGEEVAASLGISPSTFHQHLRAAERKVFRSLLA